MTIVPNPARHLEKLVREYETLTGAVLPELRVGAEFFDALRRDPSGPQVELDRNGKVRFMGIKVDVQHPYYQPEFLAAARRRW